MAFDPRLLWLIQENRDDRRAVREVQDILDQLEVRWIGVEIDFKSMALPAIAELSEGDLVLCWGPSFVRRWDHSSPFWRIGCIFDPLSFRWSQFREHWQGLMLCANAEVSTVSDLRSNLPMRPTFIRPDADSKAFDGGVRSPLEVCD